VSDGAVSVIEIGEHGLSEPRLLGFHEGTEHLTGFHPRGELLATSNAEGTIKLWSLATAEPPRVLQGPAGILGLQGIPGLQFVDGPRLVHYSYSVDERRSLLNVWSLAIEKPGLLRSIELDFGRQAGAVLFESAGYRCASGFGGKAIRLYSLRTPEGAEPVTLTRGASSCFPLGFSTDGDFLLTKDTEGLALWPLTRALPAVIRQHEEAVLSVVFDPRGQWLASGSADRFVKLWPLAGEVPDEGRTVFVELNSGGAKELQVSPDGARLGVSLGNRSPQIVSLDGQTEKPYEDLFSRASAPAFSADGRYVAVAGLRRGNVRDALFVWKVGSGNEPVILEPERNLDYLNVRFLRNGKVLHGGKSGLWSSDPETGESELLHRAVCWHFDVSEDERWIALVELSEFSVSGTGPAVLLDLETGTATPLDSHGDQLWSIAIDATGSMVVTGDNDGVIRVGPASGEEPHLLLGHEGRVWSVAIDPLGRWIASGGEDTTVRLWPMPDLSKPPLHTLPREELIAKLKTLTNLRVVRDPESATGWKLTHDPFPGWETVPTW
jgi:WD40 repeat protein